MLSSCQQTPSLAQGIPDNKLLLAIAGEAEGLSLYEQEAIARATMNRGTLKGVYGYDRVVGHVLSLKTLETAKKALKQAYSRDITNHATHWLSQWDIKNCRPGLISWRHKMKVTLVTKHFTFYREG